MPKNIVTITNRLFTTFMLLIAIIYTQNMTQKSSNSGLTIRIERPVNGAENIYSNTHAVEARDNYAVENNQKDPEKRLVTSHQ